MTSIDKIPTIVRMAFRVAPERVGAFETKYKEKLAPILKRHGLVEISPRSPFWKRGNVMLRPVIEGVFVRRFRLRGPAQLVKKQEALQSDPAYQEALRDLTAQFGGGGSESVLNRLTFESTPVGPGKTIPAGPGRGHFRTYDGVDGLVSNWVSSILQDREGHLWFTTDGGVSRYDGQSWRKWNTKDGLIPDHVRQVLQDREGVFWFGTSGGVSRYDRQVWRNLTTKDGLADGWVTCMLEDREGALWFGTGRLAGEGGGVSRYDGKVWKTFTTEHGLANNTVWAIFQDREGALWFGTNGGGVSRYDGKEWTTFTTEHGLASNIVSAIFQDQEGHLWFGTGGPAMTRRGVSRYDGKTWTTFTTEHGLASNRVSAIFQDREGMLWFGSGIGGDGVSRYDGQVFTSFTTADGLASNSVGSILQDREGHLWFGTSGGGASRYDRQVFTSFTAADGLANNWVRSIAQDREGALWFGTFGSGVSQYDGTRWMTFTTEDGLAGNMVRSVFQDQAGHLWFGTLGSGVSRYDGQRVTTFSVPDGVHQSMFSMIQDREGYIWIGTQGDGVRRYDGKVWTTLTAKDGLADDDVRSVFDDREGALWFGTFGSGVSRYRDGQFETITEKDGLANNTVWSIFQDCDGAMWFGTIGGLSRYDGKAWTTLTREDGLTHEVVYAICQDREGVLWFGTGGGISRYDGHVFQTLTHQDGLVGNQVYAIFQDTEGALWFGTSNGVTRYCKPPASPPPVFVDAITADRRYEEVSELAIPSTVGLIGFEFHGMSLKTRPEAMVYRYRLKGFEEVWRNTRIRRVEYENLPLGDYTFEVVAVDRDLVYSEAPATVQLHVVRDVRDEQIDELERRVRERTRALEEANRELVVEAALERVRVAALAMKSSTDLAQTGTVVFQQLKELGVPALRGGFVIVRETSSRPVFEFWGLTGEGIIIRGVEIPVDTHGLFERLYAAWTRGDDNYQEEITGDPLKDYIRALQRTGYPAELPTGWTTYHACALLFTDGGLYAITQDGLSDEDVAVLRRFRDVFSFAYTRFLDLQKGAFPKCDTQNMYLTNCITVNCFNIRQYQSSS